MAGSEKMCKVKGSSGNNGVIPYSQLLDQRSAQSLNERASIGPTAEFLKELPCHNENNFSRFQPDTLCKSNMKKPTMYIPSKDHPCEQIITSEKTTILLRYLQLQYERKRHQLTREAENAGPSWSSDPVPRKRPRLQLNFY